MNAVVWPQVKPRSGEAPRLPFHQIDLSGERMAQAERIGELTAERDRLAAELDALRNPQRPLGAKWERYGLTKVAIGSEPVDVLYSLDVDEDQWGHRSAIVDDVCVWVGGKWLHPHTAYGDAGIAVAEALVEAIEEQRELDAREAAEEHAAAIGEGLRDRL